MFNMTYVVAGMTYRSIAVDAKHATALVNLADAGEFVHVRMSATR